MKMRLLVFLVLLVASYAAYGQGTDDYLIDRFGGISCSDLRGRLDRFLLELAKDEKSVGYVVVNNGQDEWMTWRRRRLVENHILYREFDSSRIIYLRQGSDLEHGVELWKAAVGSKLPAQVEWEWPYSLQKRSEAFLLIQGGYDASECAPPSDPELVARFLRANPDARSNIVIRCKGIGCFQRERKDIREKFLKREKISNERVRYFYVPIRTDYYTVEYWLVP